MRKTIHNLVILVRSLQLVGIWSYHPHIVIVGRRIGHIIGSMTQWAVEVVSQEPLLQTFSVEDMQAAQVADLFRAGYLLQTNSAKETVSNHSMPNTAKHTRQTAHRRPLTTRDSPSWSPTTSQACKSARPCPTCATAHWDPFSISETTADLGG